MDTMDLRNIIADRIENEVARPLLDIIEEYTYSILISKDKVLEVLTMIYGLSAYITKQPNTQADYIRLMLETRKKCEVLYRVFSSGQHQH
jgi:hypothetical protein